MKAIFFPSGDHVTLLIPSESFIGSVSLSSVSTSIRYTTSYPPLNADIIIFCPSGDQLNPGVSTFNSLEVIETLSIGGTSTIPSGNFNRKCL